MFERPQGGERAVLVHLELSSNTEEEQLDEFRELATSAGVKPVTTVTGSRAAPHPRYFAGTGKAEEIRDAVRHCNADIVLFNHTLSPVQERNLEKLLECQVLDRTGLILDIFAQRARTHEGKLQVELAQLKHLSTRLVRGWTHLERQKGGIGLRGPGETQLETDRRLIGARIRQLNKKLNKVRSQREQGRRARKRAQVPTVSLVGYTNAGKSTLFNCLTDADVLVEDKLFATLDPTLRRIELPEGQAAILADTVGFIRHLPHDLVEAFRSTLDETRDADLLLHIVDASDEQRESNILQVNEVLRQIGADKRPTLMVYNKIDRLKRVELRLERDAEGKPSRVLISALDGSGMDTLLAAIHERLYSDLHCYNFELPAERGKLHARIYELGNVLQESCSDRGNWLMRVEFHETEWNILNKEEINQYIVNVEDESILAVAGEGT